MDLSLDCDLSMEKATDFLSYFINMTSTYVKKISVDHSKPYEPWEPARGARIDMSTFPSKFVNFRLFFHHFAHHSYFDGPTIH